MARHGLILWEKDATGARKGFRYLRGLRDTMKTSKKVVRMSGKSRKQKVLGMRLPIVENGPTSRESIFKLSPASYGVLFFSSFFFGSFFLYTPDIPPWRLICYLCLFNRMIHLGTLFLIHCHPPHPLPLLALQQGE